MSRRQILLLIGFTVLAGLIGFALYYVFFRPIVTPQTPLGNFPTNQPTNQIGLPTLPTPSINVIPQVPPSANLSPEVLTQIPETQIQPQQLIVSQIASGGLTAVTSLTDRPTFAPKTSGSDVRFLDSSSGKFLVTSPDGTTKELSDKSFSGAQTITWAPQGNQAIMEFPDGSNVLYNFDTQKQITFPKHWEDFQFDTTGSQIAYKSLGVDSDNNWLAVVNPDGSGARVIEPMGDNASDVIVSYSPNQQVLAFSKTGRELGFDQEEIYLIGFNQENFKSLIVNGRGFTPLWSPTGDRILYSVYSTRNAFKPELWIVGGQGEDIGSGKTFLNLFTFADKCVFRDNTHVICAVPVTLPERSGMFPELAKDTNDVIYEIDIANNTKRILAVPNENISVKTLSLSSDQKFLFANDTSNRTLKIELK